MTRFPPRIAALFVAAALAGCAAPAATQDAPAADVPSSFPPGCDASRAAAAHHADGRAAVGDPQVMVCFHRLEADSYEPTIGIMADGTLFVYPAVVSETTTPRLSLGTGEGLRSSDGGATWTPFTPDAAGARTHPYSVDPYLYVDPATSRVFVEDLLLVPPTCGMLSFSDDSGRSWSHAQSGCMQGDHVTIFAGPPVSSPTLGYPNVVYRCAIAGGMLEQWSTMVTCQRSLDGGTTWLPPGEPAFTFPPYLLGNVGPAPGCSGGSGHGTTGADGIIYLPRGHCRQPWLAMSRDEGTTWTRVQVSDLGIACPVYDGPGQGIACAHDTAVAVDAAGNIYYAWVTAERWLMLTHSTDGGFTWSKPRNLTAPGLNEAAFVQMAAGGVGKLAFAYLGTSTGPRPDFELAAYADTLWNGYLAVTHDALAEDPTFLTARVNEPDDPLIRGPCGLEGCGAIADFIDIRIAPDGTPWAPFVDGCFEACNEGEMQDGTELVTARLVGGPSLWDASDANGPYPGGAPMTTRRAWAAIEGQRAA